MPTLKKKGGTKEIKLVPKKKKGLLTKVKEKVA